MDKISEGGLALLCLTDEQDCCSLKEGQGDLRIGEWYFPNGMTVDRMGDVYRRRSRSVVLLNRRNNATLSSGIYHCEIPDKQEILQHIYIGIYPNGSGMLDDHYYLFHIR